MTGCWLWWHDFLEMLGAVGAAAAVLIAVFGYRRERADRRAAEDDRKQAIVDRDEAREATRQAQATEARRIREDQARRIALKTVISRHAPIAQVALYLHNYSDLPVTEVEIHHQGAPIAAGYQPLAGALDPGKVHSCTAEVPLPTDRADWHVSFVDVNGVRWLRRFGEPPYELPDQLSV